MNSNRSKTRIVLLIWAAVVVTLSAGFSSGAYAAEEDTELNQKKKVNQSSRSWYETLTWEERRDILQKFYLPGIATPCSQRLTIKVFDIQTKLLSEFVIDEDFEVQDRSKRILLSKSDFLMSTEDEMYFMLFE